MLLGACSSSRLALCSQRDAAKDSRPGHIGACQRVALVLGKQRHSTAKRGHRATCCAQLHAAELPIQRSLRKPAKLAIFVSGGGSNFRAIHDAILMGRMHAQISVRTLPQLCHLHSEACPLLRKACSSDRPL